jgi:hypothetical protein
MLTTTDPDLKDVVVVLPQAPNCLLTTRLTTTDPDLKDVVVVDRTTAVCFLFAEHMDLS